MLPYETSLPLRIELRPSRILRIALVVLAFCALLAVQRSAAPWPALIVVPILLALSWPRNVHAWRTLTLRADGSAVAQAADGSECEATVTAVDVRGPLTLLRFEGGGRTLTQMLLPDTLDADARRLLRLWAERHATPRALREEGAHV